MPVMFPDEAAAEWTGWAGLVTLMNVLSTRMTRLHCLVN